jgi:serine/threonine-protein kinase RsbW
MARKKPVQSSQGAKGAQPYRLEQSVPATAESVDSLLKEILQGLRRTRCPCGDLDEIRLALREALNNAVKHGSALDPSKKVHVHCRCDAEQGFWISIRDEGRGFNPEVVPDPTAPENLERFSGRGLYMIRELMDQVEFYDHGREIQMSRRPRR